MNEPDLFTDILRPVSRAFYLTIRVLPEPIRRPVATAYLLARAADTLADTTVIPPAQRLGLLKDFRRRVAAAEGAPELPIAGEASPGEQALLDALAALFSAYARLPASDRQLVAEVVDTLISGMEFDLDRFPAERSGALEALEAGAELDRYTFLVAGCVGSFWTRVSARHVGALRDWDIERMTGLGIRFGKALQLTNVLRDLPRDLRIGRCYLPRSDLEALGLTPQDLLDPGRLNQLRPLLDAWLETALRHYAAALDYIVAIPWFCLRLRLAVLWPALIGLGTLARLASEPGWLDPSKVVKVSRPWIYLMMAASFVAAPVTPLIRRWTGVLSRSVSRRTRGGRQ